MDLVVLTDRYLDGEGRFPHGAAVHLGQVVKALAMLGHTVRVVQWGALPSSLAEGSVRVDTIPAASFHDFLELAGDELAGHLGPIHLNNVDCAPALGPARKGTRVTTATIHTNAFLRDPTRLTLREIAGRLSAVGVINRRYLGALRGVGRPVVWLPSAVDTAVMSAGEEVAEDQSVFRILLPARPVRAKGVVFAAGLLPSVVRRIARPVELVYTGSPADDVIAEIYASAAEQSGAVRVVPWRRHGPSMAELYRTAHVVILPSDSEACGLSLLEAMACGIPVVASPQANAARAVRHRQTGLCAPLNSHREWSECLVEIASDRDLATRLGKAGARAVRRRHRIDSMVSSYVDLFRIVGAIA